MRLVNAWMLTGVVDGLYAIVLNVYVYNRCNVTRLFQGIASTLLGKDALTGGAHTAAIGGIMHFGVAFVWSAVFLLLVVKSPRLSSVLDSPGGEFKVAAVYGPLIWVVMSGLVVPALLHRPPTVSH